MPEAVQKALDTLLEWREAAEARWSEEDKSGNTRNADYYAGMSEAYGSAISLVKGALMYGN